MLASEDGGKKMFNTKWQRAEGQKVPSFWNGLFSTISFLLGASTSILSGYLGMKIATFANARTAAEARKGVAPAFMCGELPTLSQRRRAWKPDRDFSRYSFFATVLVSSANYD